MNNNFIKKYQTRLMKRHFIVLLIFTIVVSVLLYVQDHVFNGAIVDMIYDMFGYDVAVGIMVNKEAFAILIGFISLFIGWIIVEIRAVKELGAVINQMDIMFHKDDELLELNDDFKEIQERLNQLKRDNIRNEQLAEIEVQRKNDLIAYLAHDIRTPLSSVIGYLSLLDESRELSEEQRKKYTKITLDKACRVEQLINEFFEITRFNISTIPLEKEAIALPFMLAQMADEFYPVLSKTGRRIELKVPDELTVYADPNKLARVFNNIIKNAVAYSYMKSVIYIEAYQENNEVTILIANKGKEIPKEQLNMIFDKFYRLDSARSTYTGGAGLGLAIAKEIVVAHGGSIDVTSKNDTTCFIIKIPRIS